MWNVQVKSDKKGRLLLAWKVRARGKTPGRERESDGATVSDGGGGVIVG